MSTNRIVATLTPLAAVLAGASADWLAKHAPGVEVPASALEEVFIGGIAAVVAPAAVWMLGWQKHEAREAAAAERAESFDLAAAEPAAGAVVDPLIEDSPAVPEELIDLDDLDVADDEDLEDDEELDGDEELDDGPIVESAPPPAPQSM